VSERAVAIGAQAVQIFSSNPRTWQTRRAAREEMAALVAGLRHHRLALFFHTIYLINLASPDESLRSRSADSLAHALVTGARAGAAGVVTHVGSHRGEGFDAALSRVVEAVRAAEARARASLAALNETAGLPPLLLETGAGAGAVVGARLEELAALVGALNPRVAPSEATLDVGLCLDTAHMFAAGYPVHEAAGLEAVIDELTGGGLLSKVGLIHLNDSGGAFASNRDRHANPGEGLIGYDALGRVVRHPALAHIPFVLETPGTDGHGPDAANIAVVRAMRAGAPAPRTALARAARRPAE
jgi:deoxyribonuclease-4